MRNQDRDELLKVIADVKAIHDRVVKPIAAHEKANWPFQLSNEVLRKADAKLKEYFSQLEAAAAHVNSPPLIDRRRA